MTDNVWPAWLRRIRRRVIGPMALPAHDMAERRAALAIGAANTAQPAADWTLPLGTGGGQAVEGTPRGGRPTLVVAQGEVVTTWVIGSGQPVAARRGALTSGVIGESADCALARFDGSRLEVWPAGAGKPQVTDAPASPLRAEWEPQAAQGYFHLDVLPQMLGFDDENALVTVSVLQHGPDGGPGASWGGGAHHVLWWRCGNGGIWQVTDERLHTLGNGSVPRVVRLDGAHRALLQSAWMDLRTGARTVLPGPMRWAVGRSQTPDRSHVLAGDLVALRDPADGVLQRAWRLESDGRLDSLPAIPDPPPRRRPQDRFDPGGPLWIMADLAAPDGRHLVLATNEEVATDALADPLLRAARSAAGVIAQSQAALTWWDLQARLPRRRLHLIDSRRQPLLFTADAAWLVLDRHDSLAAYRTSG